MYMYSVSIFTNNKEMKNELEAWGHWNRSRSVARSAGCITDALGPLKSVASGALHFAKLIENYHSNKEAWRDFGKYVQIRLISIARVAESLANESSSTSNNTSSPLAQSSTTLTPEKLRTAPEELNGVLHVMSSTQVEEQKSLSGKGKFMDFWRDRNRIQGLEKNFDKALSRFSLTAQIHIAQDVHKTVQLICSLASQLDAMEARTSAIQTDVIHIATLTKLPYAKGATWSPGQICQAGTRKTVLGEVMDWMVISREPPLHRSFA